VSKDVNIIDITNLPPVLTAQQVASLCQCSPRHVYDLVQAGAIKGVKMGRIVRITRRAVLEFLGLDSEDVSA